MQLARQFLFRFCFSHKQSAEVWSQLHKYDTLVTRAHTAVLHGFFSTKTLTVHSYLVTKTRVKSQINQS